MSLSTSRPLVYAHRGASARFAEHTRAAYLQALGDGADGVECDVHLTQDGHVVLLHDTDLDRTSTGTGPVAEKTLAELRELDFHSWKGATVPPEFGAASEQFLTLDELLDILGGAGREMGLAIEFKHPSPFGFRLEEKTLELLERRGWDATTGLLGRVRVSFMSFDPAAVEELLRTVLAEAVCQLVADVDEDAVAPDMFFGELAAPAIAAFLRAGLRKAEGYLDDGVAGIAGPGVAYLRDHEERAARWLADGRRFRVWTVDDDADVDFCVAFGVQEITTNRPAEVLARLASRV
ncbi:MULTISPECIES: glycerophosphodiester phosphodiesterase family protein [Arthrobacter]|uniref:Glycerophosphodiester phosphodiesterase family protein n=2 Tax=Arthrobacter TaxID=1663 RepID=A0ABU9KJ53_9MICC|nr:glycerophosphodiester phosphodiesterase family protein [Arthrobacter sp. YJM1]MDP5226373.1 glycerophosphodiester phosphodiesterase family protein [Arthrobacter sp. YJM1]